jgi:hypothetical protein
MRVADMLVDIAHILNDLLNCLRIGCEDSCDFVIDLLEEVDIHPGEFSVPIVVPIASLFQGFAGLSSLAFFKIAI